jgi:hypothetical protein
MKKQLKLIPILLFVLIPSQLSFSQTDTIPLSLTKKYYGGELKNYKSYFATETIDQDFDPKKISKKAVVKYETLLNSEKKTVIAVSVVEKYAYSDSYVLWINDNGWKLKSIRMLWLPAIFHIMLSEFKNLTEEGIKLKYNEILKSTLENDSSQSEAEVLKQLGNFDEFMAHIKTMNLTVLPDKDLIAHFNKNKDKFNYLLAKVKQDNPDKAQTWQYDYKSVYKSTMQEITISSITNLNNPKIINFIIGGMSDNFAGYFYCENPADLPPIDSKGYIMIRTLGNGWYFYKTT